MPRPSVVADSVAISNGTADDIWIESLRAVPARRIASRFGVTVRTVRQVIRGRIDRERDSENEALARIMGRLAGEGDR